MTQEEMLVNTTVSLSHSIKVKLPSSGAWVHILLCHVLAL